MKNSSHTISVPAFLEVEKGGLCKIGELLLKSNIKNVVLFLGNGIKELFGHQILSCLNNTSIEILAIHENDNIEINNIINLAFDIPAKTEAIVGIGGGKVLDAAKYMCFINKLPFISVPTSTSNDGFSSSGCSLIINGKRTSVSAKMPYGIIVDLDIIKNAPEKFIYSGIGDVLSKITALFDWYYEQKNGKAIVDDFAAMIAKKAVTSFLNTPFKSIKDEEFLKELIDSLTLSGISMEIAETSTPASGSEHLISHALDKFIEHPQLHGIQVGIATYIMSNVQNHMQNELKEFLFKTGFFDYVKNLKMMSSDFLKAIDIAPTIKPHRYTFLHNEQNRKLAKEFILKDNILNDILI